MKVFDFTILQRCIWGGKKVRDSFFHAPVCHLSRAKFTIVGDYIAELFAGLCLDGGDPVTECPESIRFQLKQSSPMVTGEVVNNVHYVGKTGAGYNRVGS